MMESSVKAAIDRAMSMEKSQLLGASKDQGHILKRSGSINEENNAKKLKSSQDNSVESLPFTLDDENNDDEVLSKIDMEVKWYSCTTGRSLEDGCDDLPSGEFITCKQFTEYKDLSDITNFMTKHIFILTGDSYVFEKTRFRKCDVENSSIEAKVLSFVNSASTWALKKLVKYDDLETLAIVKSYKTTISYDCHPVDRYGPCTDTAIVFFDGSLSVTMRHTKQNIPFPSRTFVPKTKRCLNILTADKAVAAELCGGSLCPMFKSYINDKCLIFSTEGKRLNNTVFMNAGKHKVVQAVGRFCGAEPARPKEGSSAEFRIFPSVALFYIVIDLLNY